MVFAPYSDKRNPKRFVTLGFLLFLSLPGCSSPPFPPEVMLAERMSHELWKAKAHLYDPEAYQVYETILKKIRDDLRGEEAKFIWFRDYEPMAGRLKAVLREGERMLKHVPERKRAKRANTSKQLSIMEEKITDLDRLSLTINEGRLARRSLTKASLMIKEAGFLLDREDYDGVSSRLKMASSHLKVSEGILLPIFRRYTDKALIAKWRRWVHEVKAESWEKEIPAIVVSKMDKRLIIYRHGRPFKTYEIGIGRNGLADKRRAGDGATPEGSYRVIKKKAESRYQKALLLDYPNDEDTRRFLRLKKRGLIPKRAGIGGSIEIHGDGKDGMTSGCISLENRHMEEVFEMVPLGTPVAIVGVASQDDDVSTVSKKMRSD